MRSLMRPLLATGAAAALSLALLATDGAAQCPAAGVTAVGFGTGTGVCSSATLQASFDAGACTLGFGYAQDSFWCGNTFLTQHLLIVGLQPLPGGVPVGDPFLPGSRLYVLPLTVLGPFPGAASSFSLDGAPALSGVTIQVQTAPTWITTVSLPIEPQTGLSSALTLTFL
jgi:hypothetical protein